MSAFGAAFDRLDRDTQMGICKRLSLRKSRYRTAMAGGTKHAEVVLLGDTPGPQRLTAPGYHHTPFYSTKNSSLWLNLLLTQQHIPETSLLWFNTTLADGSTLDPAILKAHLEVAAPPEVICLGANAEKWLRATQIEHPYHKVHHPQAWKRFHSSQPYPLIDLLKSLLDLQTG